MPTVALIDYGAGNLTSVIKGLSAVGATARVVTEPQQLQGADGIAIPGVGHFNATASLNSAWRGALREAIDRNVPLIGICLGLQWLFEGSDETPELPGFGLLAGRCFRLSGDVKVPHVGWNTLDTGARKSRLLEGVPPEASAYFTHSYAAPVTDALSAKTTHGVPFAAAVERGHVFGVQFHPEKSGPTGLRILRNFVAIAEGPR